MTTRTYPYDAWHVNNRTQPQAVKLTHASWTVDYDVAYDGGVYDTRKLYPTREAAITAAHAKIAERRARLVKQAAQIDKNEQALRKLEAAA